MSLSPTELDRERGAAEELGKMTNWNRWGKEDERGALNFVTPEAIRRGVTSVKQGKVYPLGLPVRENNVPLLEGRPAPIHLMAFDGGDFAAGAMADKPSQMAEDYVIIGTHGTTTHMDALCHIWEGHQMYNGFSGNFVRSYGATRLGIENVEGIITKGVLLDLAGYRGVDIMASDDLITEDDIRGCMESQGVNIESGDAVLVRTGWTNMFYQDQVAYSGLQPGVGPSAGLYLAQQGICAIGADNTAVNPYHGYNARYPNRPLPDDPRASLGSLHVPYLRNLGIYLLEMLTLEKLAHDKVYEFLLCVAPLLIKGGTASPINPLAVV